eukprot:4013037-Prymnesium_polylepis.1
MLRSRGTPPRPSRGPPCSACPWPPSRPFGPAAVPPALAPPPPSPPVVPVRRADGGRRAGTRPCRGSPLARHRRP